MRQPSRLAAALPAAALAGCALAGPVADPAMTDAPYAACHRFAPAPGAPRCITLLTGGEHVSGVDLAAGRLRAGDRLRGMLTGGEGCPSAYFTHLTLEGASDGPGAMRVAAHDAIGRGTVAETFDWDEAGPRRWAHDGIGSPLFLPASFSVEMVEGEVSLDQVCFKSYER